MERAGDFFRCQQGPACGSAELEAFGGAGEALLRPADLYVVTQAAKQHVRKQPAGPSRSYRMAPAPLEPFLLPGDSRRFAGELRSIPGCLERGDGRITRVAVWWTLLVEQGVP